MITFSHAYKVFGNGHQGLRNVSLTIDKGEFVFLSGPSGAGKTTMFRLISGFDRPSSGAVSVLGTDVAGLKRDQVPYFRRRVGVVYQDYRLLQDHTVFENVALPLVVRGERRAAIERGVREVLDQVGLSFRATSLARELSGGEQQRVSIARALIHQPAVLVADEPTGNLDFEMSRGIFQLLENVNARGTTVFVATHDAELIKQKPYRVVRLRDGALADR
jgi:cell division transport system ATP-binding protein